MIEIFFPKLYLRMVEDINLDLLICKNIKGLVLDIDNTLVSNLTREPDEVIINWIHSLRNAGIKLCIVSNAKKDRVDTFTKKLNIMAIYKAAKPMRKGFERAAELMGLKHNEVAVVGDQLFTDIYGGNRMGMFTILVKPIDKKELFQIRLKRIFEKYLLIVYKKRQQNQGENNDY